MSQNRAPFDSVASATSRRAGYGAPGIVVREKAKGLPVVASPSCPHTPPKGKALPGEKTTQSDVLVSADENRRSLRTAASISVTHASALRGFLGQSFFFTLYI
jgi:hypothetical protein